MSTHIIHGMAVEVDGEGPPLLAIHGLGGSSNTWTPLLPALHGFKLIRPDLPGSARSALSAQPLSIPAYVNALAQLLTALDATGVHVLAHSMGSIIAQHLAVGNPAQVKSLVLFGPLSAPPDAARPGILARAQAARGGLAAMQDIANAIVKAATSAQTQAEQPAVVALVRESIMRQSPEGYAQSCEALAQAQSAELERLRLPTLLITGDQDGVAPPAQVRVLSSRIAGSQQRVFEGCGHWTPFEKPQRCMQEIRPFLAAIA